MRPLAGLLLWIGVGVLFLGLLLLDWRLMLTGYLVSGTFLYSLDRMCLPAYRSVSGPVTVVLLWPLRAIFYFQSWRERANSPNRYVIEERSFRTFHEAEQYAMAVAGESSHTQIILDTSTFGRNVAGDGWSFRWHKISPPE